MSGTEFQQIKREEIFTVELEENLSTGYHWRFIEMHNVELKGITTRVEVTDGFEDTVGVGHTKIFFMEAKEVGEFELIFELRRPWENNAIKHHHMHISVSEDR